jgi:hypothetical protein
MLAICDAENPIAVAGVWAVSILRLLKKRPTFLLEVLISTARIFVRLQEI